MSLRLSLWQHILIADLSRGPRTYIIKRSYYIAVLLGAEVRGFPSSVLFALLLFFPPSINFWCSTNQKIIDPNFRPEDYQFESPDMLRKSGQGEKNFFIQPPKKVPFTDLPWGKARDPHLPHSGSNSTSPFCIWTKQRFGMTAQKVCVCVCGRA